MIEYIDLWNKKESIKNGVYIYGAGYYGVLTCALLRMEGVNVIQFFDMDEKKNNKLIFEQISCTFPMQRRANFPVVIAIKDKMECKEIADKMKQLGYKKIMLVNGEILEKKEKVLCDADFLQVLYWKNMHRKLNLEKPETFNEKIQWLKLNDRKKEYVIMADKYKVKKYVADKIGEEYVIPIIGVWDDVDDINIEDLPEKFVMKCTHDSGGVYICTNKSLFDFDSVKKDLKKRCKYNFFEYGREWVYKDIEPRIIVEKYLENGNGERIVDYKFMCFNGKHRCTFVCDGRGSTEGLHVTFYDKNWEIMPFERHYPRRTQKIEKPQYYQKMIDFAELLAENTKFLRVDFYEVGNRLYFGELTFYPGTGLEEFVPEEWDYKLGSWINLDG